MTKAEKRFEWLCSFSIIRYRFIHEILMMMDKVSDINIPTMGVRVLGAKFELRYNPNFLMSLTDAEAMYVFSHECLHLVLHHCTRRKFDSLAMGNVATDLAVNELIEESAGSCEKPKALVENEKTKKLEDKLIGCFVEEFEKNPMFKGILHKQSSEWYYDFLKQKCPEIKIISRGSKGEGGDEDGKSGSGSGGTKCESVDDHDGWDGDNEIADEIVRAKVEELSRNNKWGDMSAGTVERIMAAQKSKVNWRRFIRRFVGNLVWKERETTVKRPNRRTGFVHPGFKKVHADRILLAVDTSGSVGGEDLSQFLREMNKIQDVTPLDVMQFDAEKTEGPFKYDRRKAEFEFKGRGGTDFQPVIDTCMKQKYKGLIILTDGEAQAPTKPPSTRVIWALTEASKTSPVDWGQRVWIKD